MKDFSPHAILRSPLTPDEILVSRQTAEHRLAQQTGYTKGMKF